jgi:hypothetical protein
MSAARRLLTLATGCLAFALILPAAAQDQAQASCPSGNNATIGQGAITGFGGGLPSSPCQEPALPPATPTPLLSRSHEFPAAAGEPRRPDFRVASTDLGFEKGIGPAPGYAIAYQGKRYLVIDIETADGSPFFSGGSRFVIGVKGASLDVGLGAITPDKAPGSTPAQNANVVN